MDAITEALRNGRSSLGEYDSKCLLASYGLPVTRQSLVGDPDAAVAAADHIGFPAVLKASGPGLLHKTEVGGVALNLTSGDQVHSETQRLLQIEGCEAVLVQEMVHGEREFACGLVRDVGFGPCVMFGIGGILTEVLQDVCFRVAPITMQDAREMLTDIRNRGMLGQFRGQPQVDADALCSALVTLGRIGVDYDSIQAVDVNPVRSRPDGTPVAVDALVTLCQDPRGPEKPAKGGADRNLAGFFEPRSVAIVGASSTPGKPGHEVIRNLLANQYSGNIYLVNPKGGEILGLPVYPSVDDLPDGIDQAVIIVAAGVTIDVVRQCIARGIKFFVLSAGGFSEIGDQGAELQTELAKIVSDTGVSIIGPNTSGHTSTPHCFTSSFFPLGRIPRGKISYIAQTGNFATHTMRYISTAENFGVSRVVGLGNKVDVDESDVLEYYGQDPETDAVFMYLESLKQPRRFLDIARQVTNSKPVVLLKGGSTSEGSQAAVAHTSAMASDQRIIEGALKQAGIAQIADYSHLVLAAKALALMPLPKSNRISFLAPSGAMLVVLTDLCRERWGLEVPQIEDATRNRLQQISASWIRMRNPVDIWAAAMVQGIEPGYSEGIRAVMEDPNIDVVVPILVLVDELGIPRLDFLVELARTYPEKPLYVTFSGIKDRIDEAKTFLEQRGVPTYELIEQPFEVLSILVRCRQAMDRAPRLSKANAG